MVLLRSRLELMLETSISHRELVRDIIALHKCNNLAILMIGGEHLELSEASARAQQKHAEMLAKVTQMLMKRP